MIDTMASLSASPAAAVSVPTTPQDHNRPDMDLLACVRLLRVVCVAKNIRATEEDLNVLMDGINSEIRERETQRAQAGLPTGLLSGAESRQILDSVTIPFTRTSGFVDLATVLEKFRDERKKVISKKLEAIEAESRANQRRLQPAADSTPKASISTAQITTTKIVALVRCGWSIQSLGEGQLKIMNWAKGDPEFDPSLTSEDIQAFSAAMQRGLSRVDALAQRIPLKPSSGSTSSDFSSIGNLLSSDLK